MSEFFMHLRRVGAGVDSDELKGVYIGQGEEFSISEEYEYGYVNWESGSAYMTKFYPNNRYSIDADRAVTIYRDREILRYRYYDNSHGLDYCCARYSLDRSYFNPSSPTQYSCAKRKWGYANDVGDPLTPAEFDGVTELSDRAMGVVRKGNKRYLLRLSDGVSYQIVDLTV